MSLTVYQPYKINDTKIRSLRLLMNLKLLIQRLFVCISRVRTIYSVFIACTPVVKAFRRVDTPNHFSHRSCCVAAGQQSINVRAFFNAKSYVIVIHN